MARSILFPLRTLSILFEVHRESKGLEERSSGARSPLLTSKGNVSKFPDAEKATAVAVLAKAWDLDVYAFQL